MRVTTDDARTMGKIAAEIYDKTRSTGGEYREYCDKVRLKIKSDTESTEAQKKDNMHEFDRIR